MPSVEADRRLKRVFRTEAEKECCWTGNCDPQRQLREKRAGHRSGPCSVTVAMEFVLFLGQSERVARGSSVCKLQFGPLEPVWGKTADPHFAIPAPSFLAQRLHRPPLRTGKPLSAMDFADILYTCTSSPPHWETSQGMLGAAVHVCKCANLLHSALPIPYKSLYEL